MRCLEQFTLYLLVMSAINSNARVAVLSVIANYMMTLKDLTYNVQLATLSPALDGGLKTESQLLVLLAVQYFC